MLTIQEIERRLMDYFVAVGGDPAKVFGPRDFDSQVMMDAFTPEDRAGLALALGSLAHAGIVAPASPGEWQLTKSGLDRVKATRETRRDAASAGKPAGVTIKRVARWT